MSLAHRPWREGYFRAGVLWARVPLPHPAHPGRLAPLASGLSVPPEGAVQQSLQGPSPTALSREGLPLPSCAP